MYDTQAIRAFTDLVCYVIIETFELLLLRASLHLTRTCTYLPFTICSHTHMPFTVGSNNARGYIEARA